MHVQPTGPQGLVYIVIVIVIGFLPDLVTIVVLAGLKMSKSLSGRREWKSDKIAGGGEPGAHQDHRPGASIYHFPLELVVAGGVHCVCPALATVCINWALVLIILWMMSVDVAMFIRVCSR